MIKPMTTQMRTRQRPPPLRVPLHVVLQRLRTIKRRNALRVQELAEQAIEALRGLVNVQEEMEAEASEIDSYYRRRGFDNLNLHFTPDDPYCSEDNILESCTEAVEKIEADALECICFDR